MLLLKIREKVKTFIHTEYRAIKFSYVNSRVKSQGAHRTKDRLELSLWISLKSTLIGSSLDSSSTLPPVSFNILSGGRRWNPRIAIPSHAHAQLQCTIELWIEEFEYDEPVDNFHQTCIGGCTSLRSRFPNLFLRVPSISIEWNHSFQWPRYLFTFDLFRISLHNSFLSCLCIILRDNIWNNIKWLDLSSQIGRYLHQSEFRGNRNIIFKVFGFCQHEMSSAT